MSESVESRVYAKLHENRFAHVEQARRAREWQAEVYRLKEGCPTGDVLRKIRAQRMDDALRAAERRANTLAAALVCTGVALTSFVCTMIILLS